jgi:polysaccharide export outer membrane protein
VPAASQAEISSLQTNAAASPVLQAGDKLNIIVYGEPTLTAAYAVDPSGYLALPVVGTMKVAGSTTDELQRELVTRLQEQHIKDPNVTVEVAEFRPFYIMGEVLKPGVYPYLSGLNVLSALAIGGGWTYRADESKVYIQHAGEKTMHEYDLGQPIPILPGDIIQIPRRYI